MSKSFLKRKTWLQLITIILILVFSASNVLAIDGVWHNPLGYENLYTANEMLSVETCERSPRDPIAGENVYVKMTTWPIESGQATWLTWTLNGNAQSNIGGSWKYNEGNNSYWESSLGSFSKGDVISYTVHANQNGQNEKTIGPFSFTVKGWDWVTSVSSYTTYSDRFELTCNSNSGTFSPKINICFPQPDYFRLQFAPTGTGAAATGATSFTVDDQTSCIWLSTTGIKLKIIKNPYQLEVYKSDGTTLISKEYDRSSSRSLAFLTDGTSSVNKVEENFYTPTSEKFFGFGQRYNDLDKRGQNVDIYCVNWYKDQNDKAYLPVPFFVNSNKFGLYLNSTYYSQFRLGTDSTDKYTIRADAGGSTDKMLDFYFFTGSDYKNIITDYYDVTGKPALPPKWAFGPILSANEWDRQSEVEDQITASNNNSVPATAIVLEAWSDENTYYIFNDATYTPKTGSGTFSASDFTFGGKWPNPAGLVTTAHSNGMKVLLWQAPVLKHTLTTHTQKDNDETYAISQGYVLSDGNGGQYRIPPAWFQESLLPDFTNTNAKNWWFSKRAYLFDDIGIDGFKCDGGEFVYYRTTTASDGTKGDELRNAYPGQYIKAYQDYAKSKKSDALIFSRSGFSNAQSHPVTWNGDQRSSFSAFQDAIRSMLSASTSGVPFATWDLAGFGNDAYPTAELYKRSCAQAAFSPIMQLHSEQSGDPNPSQTRTPWNAASRLSDNDCLNIYKKFANTRMNLLPYLYTEAKYTCDNGVPMMRPMGIEFPNDSTALSQTFQYMLGGSLLVAPIVTQGETNKSIYLPDTEWIDFSYGAQRPGGNTISYYAGVDTLPVFVKTGSIIPMNLNSSYEVGGTIGNTLNSYNTLAFRIFLNESTSYDWYDDVNSQTKTISVSEQYNVNKVEVTMPVMGITSTLQVFTTKPTVVKSDSTTLTEYSTLSGLQSATSGWYYDTAKLLVYVKLASSTSARSIVLEGVNKASYEAEFATMNSVAVNTNHTGYNGTGFVDQFSNQGDYAEFDVKAKTAGTYTVDFRYSSGSSAASRAIYVNNTKVTDLSMSQTTNWDTWNTVSTNLLLNAGSNKIKVSYDQGNSAGINLDGIVVHSNNYVESLGNVTACTVSGDTLTLTVDNGSNPNNDLLVVQACKDNILKIDYRPNEIAASTDTPVIDPNKTWSSVGATINTSGDPITITTSKMKIEIAKNPCRVTVKKPDNTTLFWEPAAGGVYYNGVRFVRSSGQNMYGIRAYDYLEGSGDMLRNNATHQVHGGYQGDGGAPLMWSTAGYGVLLDSDGAYPYIDSNTNKMEMYYGNYDKRRYTKNDVEYYIMLGDPEEITGAVSEISGKAPMLPKWALGFMNFEWGLNQTELNSNVDGYRARNIPLDAFAMDYDWKNWGESNYGEFTWNTTNFPDAATTTLKNDMDAKGVKMIAIMKPRIVVKTEDGVTTTQASAAETGGYWYPGGSEYGDYFGDRPVRDIDFYNENCRDWYWNNMEDAFDKGMVGFWNDEAGRTSAPPYDFAFGPFQGLHMQQAIYDGQRADSTRRVWSTNRNFYLGAQRYGYTTWSGDIGSYFTNSSSDAGMQEQRERMLATINLGQAKWGMDTGGFNPWSTDPSPELYTRWMQFSSFTPVFRVHGNRYHQRQPWYYGNTAEEIEKFTIQMRYKLLPYLYAYERNAYENGVGLVRPLLYDNPSDSNVSNYMTAWMFGDWLLTAPVLEQGSTLKSVYLPSGTWIDYFRGNTYSGGQTINYPVNAETWTDVPLFIKKGAIIPSQKVLDYVGQSDITTVLVDTFPDTAQTQFTYYDDNGDNYDYENGTYIKQQMAVQDNGANGINFNVAAKTGTYTPALQYYIVQIHGKAGTGVTVNGSNATSYCDLNALKAAGGEGWTTGKDIYGEVTYVKVAAASTSAKDIIVSGSASTGLTTYKFEAEEASLSGNSTTTKATVNSNHTGYSGSGFVDGFNNTGAGVTFYANVKSAGDYDIALRYANATGSSKTISIFVNGSRVKQTSLANLANWDTWSTQTETLPLSAGNNIISYKYYNEAGDSGNVNLDYITVPFNANVQKYEAESAELAGGTAINKNHWFFTGAGFVDSITASGAEVKFKVNVPSAGNYKVVARYANGNQSTKTLSTYVNGTDAATASLSSPGADWNVWTDYEQTLNLNSGDNTIAYKYDSGDSGNVNIDRILIAATSPGTPVSEKNLLDNGGFDRSYGYSFNWTEWHPTGQDCAYGVDSGSSTNPPESPWTGEKRAYFYKSSAYQQSIHQTVSVSNGTYKFEAWVRMSGTTPTTARAEITNYGGGQLNVTIAKDGVWKYISYDNVNVTNGQIDIGFYVDSPGGTLLHIDDVRLTKQ